MLATASRATLVHYQRDKSSYQLGALLQQSPNDTVRHLTKLRQGGRVAWILNQGRKCAPGIATAASILLRFRSIAPLAFDKGPVKIEPKNSGNGVRNRKGLKRL